MLSAGFRAVSANASLSHLPGLSPRRRASRTNHEQKAGSDEAAELRRQRLEVRKQLGDLDGIANADWGMAQIDLMRDDYQSAFPRLMEAFEILRRLQRPDGSVVVGWPLGQLLMAAGQADQGRQVFSDALAAATVIGLTDLAQQISQLLNSPPQAGEQT